MRHPAGRSARLPGRGHQPQRAGSDRLDPRRRAPALAADSDRGRWGASEGSAGRRARPRQPAAGPSRPPSRPRSGEHRHRLRGWGDRQQLGGDALRRGGRLLPHRQRADVRLGRRRGDRHRPSRSGGGVRRRRARACRRPDADPGRAARRRRAGPEGPGEVRDQEHHRLPAVRLPGGRLATGDLSAAAGRLRGNARLPRRGGVRDRPARAGTAAWRWWDSRTSTAPRTRSKHWSPRAPPPPS